MIKTFEKFVSKDNPATKYELNRFKYKLGDYVTIIENSDFFHFVKAITLKTQMVFEIVRIDTDPTSVPYQLYNIENRDTIWMAEESLELVPEHVVMAIKYNL